jgi:RNA polymerase sigma factor (sigma-70 family)
MRTQVVPADYKKLSDEELVFRYAHRQEAISINYLFERYGHLVFGICLKYLKNTDAAKDATQQIFIKLLDDLKRFEIERFKPWLYQVAKNYCLRLLRKAATVVNEINSATNMEFEEEWHQKIEQEELLDELERAIKLLNEEQRSCIEMFYLQLMNYNDIAQKKGCTLMQVKSAIQNGRRNLKIKMEASRNVRS